MAMYADRNKTSHTYNEETADEIMRNVVARYFPLFLALREKMESLAEEGR